MKVIVLNDANIRSDNRTDSVWCTVRVIVNQQKEPIIALVLERRNFLH